MNDAVKPAAEARARADELKAEAQELRRAGRVLRAPSTTD